MLPSFIVVGAMKAGTTSFASYLAEHPDVFVTTPKEPNFFSMGWNRAESANRIDDALREYERLFADSAAALARGEASVSYSGPAGNGQVAERIASTVPDVKLFYLVRHPLERIRSHYINHRGINKESAPLAEAVRTNPGYLDFSRYGLHVDCYLRHFSREQILILSSEELRTDVSKVMHDAYRFVGVDPDFASLGGFEYRLNEASSQRQYPKALWVLRRVAASTRLLRAVPHSVRRRIGWPLRRRVDPASTTLPPAVERWIWDELGPDLERLREIVGPEFPLWGGF